MKHESFLADRRWRIALTASCLTFTAAIWYGVVSAAIELSRQKPAHDGRQAALVFEGLVEDVGRSPFRLSLSKGGRAMTLIHRATLRIEDLNAAAGLTAIRSPEPGAFADRRYTAQHRSRPHDIQRAEAGGRGREYTAGLKEIKADFDTILADR